MSGRHDASLVPEFHLPIEEQRARAIALELRFLVRRRGATRKLTSTELAAALLILTGIDPTVGKVYTPRPPRKAVPPCGIPKRSASSASRVSASA